MLERAAWASAKCKETSSPKKNLKIYRWTVLSSDESLGYQSENDHEERAKMLVSTSQGMCFGPRELPYTKKNQ